MTSFAWMHNWIKSLECHHLCMIMYFRGCRGTDIAGSVAQFLRPLYLVAVCRKVDAERSVAWSIRYADVERNRMVSEVPVIFESGTRVEVFCVHILPDLKTLACLVSQPLRIGLIDICNGVVVASRRVKKEGFLAYVPHERLLVLTGFARLTLYDGRDLDVRGRILLSACDSNYLTSVVGGFAHVELESCVLVAGVFGTYHVVNIRVREIIRTITLPQSTETSDAPLQLSVGPDLALTPSGRTFAVTRFKFLFCIDPVSGAHVRNAQELVGEPAYVAYLDERRLIIAIASDIMIFDTQVGEWLLQIALPEERRVRFCAASPRSNWIVLALGVGEGSRSDSEESDAEDSMLCRLKFDEHAVQLHSMSESTAYALFFV